MTEQSFPWTGRCRCDQVRLSITAMPLLTMACHCKGCQRMSASAFSLSAAFPEAGFAVAQGDPVIGGLHGADRHYFCPHCKSWMFTRPNSQTPFVNVRASMFDDTSWFAPFVEFYTSAKYPFVRTNAVHSYDRFPEAGEMPRLIEAYRSLHR
jgi:hypothetical protein